MGVVVAALFGLLFGNYATSYYHRLPLKKPINGVSKKKGQVPHCSVCGHALKFYEYFPLLSWISTRGECNYCGVKIDPVYTILEVSTMLFAIVLYYVRGFDLLYPSLLSLICVLNLLFALYHKHSTFYRQVVFTSLLIVLIIIGQISYELT